MNLQQTVSKILDKKVTIEEAKDFANDQFGTLCAFNRDWEKKVNKPDERAIKVYQDDIIYLPIQYHKMQAKQPYFKGKGELNVKELEQLCEDFKEYVHQQQVIKQNLKDIVIDLKFN